MKHFRLVSVLALVSISTAACYGMELFLGLFIDMGLAQVGRNLGVFSLTVLAVEASGALALWLILAPLARATEARAEGREPSTEALALARACVEKVPALLGALVVLGFLVGPFVVMGVNSALGRASYGPIKGTFIVLFNLAIGTTAGFQAVLVIEGILYRPIASLGLSSLPQARRKRGPVLGRRIVLAGLASTALAGVSLATAGYGALSIESTGEAGLPSYLLKAGILLVLILAWILLVFLSLSRSLSRRLGEVAVQVDLISSGKEGSSRRIHLVFDDEVGRLAAALNAFFDGLGTLLGQVGNLSGRVREGADALATSASHAGGAVGELEASLGLVRGAVERQSEIVGQAEGEIERMVEYIDTVAARVSDQAGFVDESSAAVSQMAANIESVSRTAGLAADLSHRLSEASTEGGEALKASLAAIGEIEESSRSVKEIIGVISRIASQTNLLAMNAAIEAAHAGAAGAGFAVVADEVRTLAESSSRSAKEIVGLIQGMGKRIEIGAQLSDRAGEAFGRISQGVGETGELVQTIAAAMGEQSLGAQEILRSVDSLTEASRVIKDLTGELKAESKAMTEAMLRIVSASNEIFESVQEETGSIQSLGRIVALVTEEAGKNKDHVEGMEGAVALFRTAK